MHVSYDRGSDCAYIRIVDEIKSGEAVRQVMMDSEGRNVDFILDLDRDGRLLGIEVLAATSGLRPETLALADRST